MDIPFRQRLEAKARKSALYAAIFFALVFLWEALTHWFYTWFDEWVIEGIRSSLPFAASAIGWTITHPFGLIAVSVGCYCFVLVMWAVSWPARRPAVEIVSLRDEEIVEHQQTVHGVVRSRNAPVQVFVYATDKRWYPQRPVGVDQFKWRARCYFGTLTAPPGTPFKVVAIANGDPADAPLSEIPKNGERSAIVTVRRSATIPVESVPGIYLGRNRRPLKDGWVPYTTKVGVLEGSDSVRFVGTWENGWRYPREDTQSLAPVMVLGLRFRAEGDVNFYAHFRESVILLNSRFDSWGLQQEPKEFRVPIPASTLDNNWHVVLLFLPCLEQMFRKRFELVQRFSVRGTLWLSHLWCLQNLGDLPTSFLREAVLIHPPVSESSVMS